MPDSNCEIWRQICEDVGSNILALCLSQNCSEWSNYCQGLCGASYGPAFFPNTDAISQDNISPLQTASSVHYPHANSQKCSVLVRETWRCTSISSLTSTIATLKYRRTTVVSYRQEGEKQISSPNISRATTSCYF